jgi:predicted DNA-binding transcriptional regulator AlpA
MTKLLSRISTAESIDVSPMTIKRWVSEERYAHLNFPRPVDVDGRQFFVEEEIEDWKLARLVARAAPKAA